jgi:CTP synthase
MPAPPLLVVVHATDQPGTDCLVAGALGEALAGGSQLSLFRLAPAGATFRSVGCTEHATQEGTLQANGMFWLERAGRSVATLDRLPGAALRTATVVSANLTILDGQHVEALHRWARERGALWATVVEVAAGFDVYLGPPSDGRRLVKRLLVRDAYGRLPPIDAGDLVPDVAHIFQGLAVMAPAVPVGPQPRIVVVGHKAHFAQIYPAVLASLGDAADQLGMAPAVSCVAHQDIADGGWTSVLKDADGLVLPGGTEMSQVEGQIAAATAALEQDLPTLGLCLGMQTMTTAFLRRSCGLTGAHLEETTADAPTLSFIRLRDSDGRPLHYLGEREMVVRPNTRLAALYQKPDAVERLNHRYHLNPDLIPALEQRGLTVSATTADTGVAEAAEVPGRHFFLGIQGHPELRSRRFAPHPAVVGLLREAAKIGR